MYFKKQSQTLNVDIVVTYVPTGQTVSFPSFITSFSDKYNVSWGSETIFGRVDPVKPYQGTTREVTVEFDVVSENLASAKENHQKVALLSRMVYPVYSNSLTNGNDTGRIIKAPPLWRIKYGNLIANATKKAPGTGLLGTISGFSYAPEIPDSGAYVSNGEIIPKSFKLSFNFSVLHEDTIGWSTTGEFLQDQYPYIGDAYSEDSAGSSAAQASVNPAVDSANESGVLA